MQLVVSGIFLKSRKTQIQLLVEKPGGWDYKHENYWTTMQGMYYLFKYCQYVCPIFFKSQYSCPIQGQ
jgi:hypothetical protein